ncbi:leucyl/phenylalanyl-tRNA--protein transferase [Profundibacter sp.]|uniref:leucyl/phenylalanyl-tRNA--protein transferase n=1 Tax=Profundibacter sp. TaxID=3101071 RepID=UPI003D0EBD9D
MPNPITAETLLHAYASGVFPMAESREDDELFWVDPHFRGIFELDNFHISRSLARHIRQEPFQIRTNTAFMPVVHACADRTETWINAKLLELNEQLHLMGFAHSLEIWEGNELVGGVYGLAIGGAFFGESMFSRRTNASKIALAYLIHRLRSGGFTLFDTQFITPHLASLGAIEIPRDDYRERLESALSLDADFNRITGTPDAYSVIQRNTQTS